MSRFYGALKHKQDIAKLMQQTKTDYINGCSQGELAAPYYWAGHRVMGDGEISQNKKTPQSFIYFWILGVLVVYFIFKKGLKSRKTEIFCSF